MEIVQGVVVSVVAADKRDMGGAISLCQEPRIEYANVQKCCNSNELNED